MIGQILTFRATKSKASKGMLWAEIDAREVEVVQKIIAEHIDAIIDRLQSAKTLQL